MLEKRPDICRFVKKLAVRPNYYLAWPKPDEHLDEAWVVDMLQKIAGSMFSMHTFDWDGLELPKDALWSTLRKRYVNFSHVAFSYKVHTTEAVPS